MFKPLSSAYSKQLTKHLHNAQGLLPVKKGDFFPLFWEAWTSSFQEKTILRSFQATGIIPLSPEIILKRFKKSTPEQEERENSSSVLSGEDWLKLHSLIRSEVKDQSSREAQKLSRSLHHISIQNELLHTEVEGLSKALLSKKKHEKKSKPLDLQQRQEYRGGAVFWSPSKVREAQFRQRIKDQEAEKQQLEKARKKAEQASKKVRQLQEKEERARLRIQRREEKERIAAEKQAARQRKEKEKQNTKKPTQTS
ncbi:transposase [Paraphaeosphaeria sporulosa]